MTDKTFFSLMIGVFSGVFLWSAIAPHDYFTWMLEVLPAVIGIWLLVSTHRRFRFSRLAYALMTLHAVILMVGGHYTYAEVPLFNWIRDALELSRNHYDRVGHFAQGFIPAIVAREILLRTSPLGQGRWLFFLVVSVCLAVSAAYELIEWSVAELTGTAAEAFLGTQGDVWDTQKDMALAAMGALTALLTLGRAHDASIRAVAGKRDAG
jgi:putative membrane protein